MTLDSIRQRSDLLGTQVITRDSGNRLGIISQVWVDIDRREVIGFGIKDNILSVSALPRFMALDCISKIGDVILVEDERAIEDAVDVEPYSTVVGSEVITETGELLGRVRGFKFDVEDGAVTAILVASLGVPQVPEQLISTYELPIDEVVSSGPDRLIVFEGAEDRLVQLSVGVLERLGISSPPWEREDEDLYFTPTAAPSNQLGTGLRQESVRSQRMDQGYGEEAWQEEESWGDRRTAARQRQPEPEYYAEPEYDDVGADAWDDEPEYQAPKLNIPEKTRQPEYEEGGY